jgi:hypothetical protein
VTGNRADAQELTQDAFLKLWERWDTIDRIEDPTAYLFRVALNGSRMPIRESNFAGGGLWLADPDAENPRRLVEGEGIWWPRWSPDGTRIAYSELGKIHVVDVATGATIEVAMGGVAEWFDDRTLVVTGG